MVVHSLSESDLFHLNPEELDSDIRRNGISLCVTRSDNIPYVILSPSKWQELILDELDSAIILAIAYDKVSPVKGLLNELLSAKITNISIKTRNISDLKKGKIKSLKDKTNISLIQAFKYKNKEAFYMLPEQNLLEKLLFFDLANFTIRTRFLEYVDCAKEYLKKHYKIDCSSEIEIYAQRIRILRTLMEQPQAYDAPEAKTKASNRRLNLSERKRLFEELKSPKKEMPYQYLAARTGVSPKTIYNRRKQYEALTAKKRKPGRLKRELEICLNIEAGMSYKEIALQYKVSKSTVYRIASKHDFIPRRRAKVKKVSYNDNIGYLNRDGKRRASPPKY